MKNTATPVLRPGPVRNRQVPRAPSPASGVTSGGEMSNIGGISGLQSFTHFQAPQLAWPPDCAHRKTSEGLGRPGRIHQAELWAVTGPKHWHRYVPETGNWARRDLHPLDCSLVGCSRLPTPFLRFSPPSISDGPAGAGDWITHGVEATPGCASEGLDEPTTHVGVFLEHSHPNGKKAA